MVDFDEIDDLVAELFLEGEEEELLGADESLEELFLKFLMMKLTIRRLRRRGLDYQDILGICRKIDARRSGHGEQDSGQENLPDEE